MLWINPNTSKLVIVGNSTDELPGNWLLLNTIFNESRHDPNPKNPPGFLAGVVFASSTGQVRFCPEPGSAGDLHAGLQDRFCLPS
jgi:hypothetical protein